MNDIKTDFVQSLNYSESPDACATPAPRTAVHAVWCRPRHACPVMRAPCMPRVDAAPCKMRGRHGHFRPIAPVPSRIMRSGVSGGVPEYPPDPWLHWVPCIPEYGCSIRGHKDETRGPPFQRGCHVVCRVSDRAVACNVSLGRSGIGPKRDRP